MSADPFYLSFAGDDGFRGACYLRADADAGPMSADSPVAVSHLRGCNPGGEVMVVALTEEVAALVPAEYWDTLLSKDDLEALGEIVEPGGGELIQGSVDEIAEHARRADLDD